MATVLNRSTKTLIRSAHTPNYSVSEWIINPDLSAVEGFPTKYWVITGDTVSLMSQAERDALDAAAQAATNDALADKIGANDPLLRSFAEVVLDEINALRAEHALPPRTLQQLRDAIRAKL